MGRTTNAAYKRQRHNLFHRQKGKCHWCGKPMRLLKLPSKVKIVPLDLCTIDHLDDRFSPERGAHYGEYRRVAACWNCNNERARARDKEVGMEVLRARSGAYPNSERRDARN